MDLSWLCFWRRKSRPLARVTLFTRQGCHLCDSAWELLRKEQTRHGFTLEAVDIDTDPELAARHGEEVPVVIINGKVRFRGVVNAVLLRRLLGAARQGS
jgi:glutaredoxin